MPLSAHTPLRPSCDEVTGNATGHGLIFLAVPCIDHL